MRALGKQFPEHEHPELLVGLNKADDAAVYRLNAEQAIVQTLDVFAPTVDDPYQFGAIAAANAINDIYAMGADVLFALNIAAFPEDLPAEIVAGVLEGGADKVKEAGGAIAGGHTAIDREPKYGLCVTGLVHPDRIASNAGAKPGDAIVLTKPIGTGVLINAIRGSHASPEHEAAAVELMMTLNKTASEVARDFRPHALTDVTGFGIAGHLFEIATNSAATIELSLAALPAMAGLAEYNTLDIDTAGQTRNRDYFAGQLEITRKLSPLEDTLIFDPQTTGGLLIGLAEADLPALESRLESAGVPHWRVATVVATASNSSSASGVGVRIVD